VVDNRGSHCASQNAPLVLPILAKLSTRTHPKAKSPIPETRLIFLRRPARRKSYLLDCLAQTTVLRLLPFCRDCGAVNEDPELVSCK